MSSKRKYPPSLFFAGLLVSLGRGLFAFPLTLAGAGLVFFFGCLGSRSQSWDYGILFLLFLCGLAKVIYATKKDLLKGFPALLSVIDLAASAALISPCFPRGSHWAALGILVLWVLPALSKQLLFVAVTLIPGEDPEIEEFLDMMFNPDNPLAYKKWYEKGGEELENILRRADSKNKGRDPAPYLPVNGEEEDFLGDEKDFKEESKTANSPDGEAIIEEAGSESKTGKSPRTAQDPPENKIIQ